MYYLMWTQGWSGNLAYREFALCADSLIFIIDSVLSDKISMQTEPPLPSLCAGAQVELKS